HPARLAEADEEIHVLGAGLLLDDVLEQEVPGVRIRAAAVHDRAPPRELRDVLVVLADPLAELGAGQLSVDPLLGDRVQPAVPGVDGVLELGPERARVGHDATPTCASGGALATAITARYRSTTPPCPPGALPGCGGSPSREILRPRVDLPHQRPGLGV